MVRARTTGACLSLQAGLILLALITMIAGPASAKSRGKSARVQMRFGVEMAQKGAWKEAQYRFERAAAEAPTDGPILNNLAVAYEHNGLYARAEQAYLRALQAAPDSEKLRTNYERFRLFYTDHLARQNPEGEGDPDRAGNTGEQGD